MSCEWEGRRRSAGAKSDTTDGHRLDWLALLELPANPKLAANDACASAGWLKHRGRYPHLRLAHLNVPHVCVLAVRYDTPLRVQRGARESTTPPISSH